VSGPARHNRRQLAVVRRRCRVARHRRGYERCARVASPPPGRHTEGKQHHPEYRTGEARQSHARLSRTRFGKIATRQHWIGVRSRRPLGVTTHRQSSPTGFSDNTPNGSKPVTAASPHSLDGFHRSCRARVPVRQATSAASRTATWDLSSAAGLGSPVGLARSARCRLNTRQGEQKVAPCPALRPRRSARRAAARCAGRWPDRRPFPRSPPPEQR